MEPIRRVGDHGFVSLPNITALINKCMLVQCHGELR